MKGIPPASSSAPWTATLSGTSGLFWMPVRNDAVSAEMSTAPARAVPIEAPSWVPVFWSPPTSPLCSSGTADTVTLPSCEAIAPMPGTGQQQRPGDDLGAGADVEQGDQEHEAGEQRHEPEADDPPWRGIRAQLGDAGGEQQQRQRERKQPDARLDRRQPERDRQEQRDDEEDARPGPGTWKKNEVTPSRSWMFRSIVGSISAPSPRCDAAGSPTPANRASTTPPASTSQITGESPSHSGASGLGCTKPHAPDAQDADHDQAEAERRQRGADQVEPDALLGGRVVHRAAPEARITSTISTSPTNTHRHEA